MSSIIDILKKHQGSDSQGSDSQVNDSQVNDSFDTLVIEEKPRMEEELVNIYFFKVAEYNEKCSCGYLSIKATSNLRHLPELSEFSTDVKVYIPARYVTKSRVNRHGVFEIPLPLSLVHKWLKDRSEYSKKHRG